jgi:hypothetical protein
MMPRALFQPESVDFWVHYYATLIEEQRGGESYDVDIVQQRGSGGGLPGFHAYKGYQRGGGLGSFFAGLFRRIFPILKSVGKVVGKQALSTGANIAADVVQGGDFKESATKHGKTGASNLLHVAADNLAETAIQNGAGLGNRRGGGRPKKKKSSTREVADGSFVVKRPRKTVGSFDPLKAFLNVVDQ